MKYDRERNRFTVEVSGEDDGGDYSEEITLPAKFEVCDGCQGKGTHVHRAIDGNGITASEWGEWDQDDREDYMGGRYDVTCEDCGGRNVMPVVDWASVPDEIAKRVRAQLDSDAEYAAERAHELRMGY